MPFKIYAENEYHQKYQQQCPTGQKLGLGGLIYTWGRIHKRDQAQLKLIFGSS